jgi:hypothetical protein
MIMVLGYSFVQTMKLKKHYYCLVDSNNKPDFRFIFTSKNDAEKKRRQIKNSTTGETLFVSKHKRDFFIDGIKKNFIGSEKQIDIKKGCWTTLRTTKISLLDTIKPEACFKETIQESQDVSVTEPILEFEKETTTTLKSLSQSAKNNTPAAITQKKSSNPQLETDKFKKHFSSTYFAKSENNQNKKAEFASPKVTNLKKSNKTPLSEKLQNLSNLKLLSNFKIPPNYSFLKTKLFAVNFAIILVACLITVSYTNNSSNKEISAALSKEQQKLVTSQTNTTKEIAVLGSMDKKDSLPNNPPNQKNIPDNIDSMVFDTLIEFEKIRSDQLEESIQKMVAGSPMEKMAPYIAKKDKIVAAFLVGISKKESNYGRRVPVLNGEDCFNYWGYRGIRKRMGSGGHTCFDSPEDAIETVGGRIERLVKSGVDTPEEMVLWKCGSDCNATGGWPAAHKWIADVNMYYSKMLDIANDDEGSSEKIRILNETVKS